MSEEETKEDALNANGHPVYHSFQSNDVSDPDHGTGSKHLDVTDENGARSHTKEDAKKLIEYIAETSKKFILLVVVLIFTLICLIFSYILYCIQFSQVVHRNMTYMNISDVVVVVYEFMIIVLCGLYVREYYKGKIVTCDSFLSIAHRNDIDTINDINSDDDVLVRHKSDETFIQLVAHLLENLDLNQYTVPALFCITHHLYAAILMMKTAFEKDGDKWYIAAALAFGLGAFSIPLPGICFQSHLKLCRQQEDLSKPTSSAFTAVESFQHTVFNNVVIRGIVFIGFLVQFIQYVTLPALNEEDIIVFYNTIYDCDVSNKCSENVDFVVNELIFRVFVGMTIVNNMGLFANGLHEDSISEYSLTSIRTIIHPLVYPFMLLSLMTEVRFGADSLPIINFILIIVHVVTIFILFWLINELYTGYIKLRNKKLQALKVNYTIGIEAVCILFIALLSWIFIAMGGIDYSLWRQLTVWFYLLVQIFVVLLGNTLQKVKHFSKTVPIDWGLTKGFFRWLCIVNLYDFLYSFAFDSQKFIDWVNNGSGGNGIYYRWSFGLSFSFSHLLMWSLALCIEFIMGLDHDISKQAEPQRSCTNDHIDGQDVVCVDNSNDTLSSVQNPKKNS